MREISFTKGGHRYAWRYGPGDEEAVKSSIVAKYASGELPTMADDEIRDLGRQLREQSHIHTINLSESGGA